jgi:hypothetical protein
MKAIALCTSFWLVLFAGMAGAEAVETSKCKKLAHEFAENLDALNEMQLKQLQFCITQTLEQRAKTDPPDLLKGTIINPPSSSPEAPGTTPQTPSPHPGDRQ